MGLVLAVISETASETVFVVVGVFVILVVLGNCVAIAVVVVSEIRYQWRLIQRGIKGGFASDEVVVSDEFFDLNVRLVEQSRNLKVGQCAGGSGKCGDGGRGG